VGEREDLLQPVEFVEQRKPRVDVPQRLDARERAEHRMAGDQLAQPVEIRLRHEVVEDVDHGAATLWAKRHACKIACQPARLRCLLPAATPRNAATGAGPWPTARKNPPSSWRGSNGCRSRAGIATCSSSASSA